MTNPDAFVPKTEWEVLQFNRVRAEAISDGISQGWAKSILFLLDSRGVEVPASSRERILSCQDEGQLGRWLVRAATAATAEDLFRN